MMTTEKDIFVEILEAYIAGGYDPQSVLDIFKGEWSSRMPAASELTTEPANAALFEDGRIQWLGEMIGGFAGKNVLELGPLEAGHTYMMHEGGAKSIKAIEANSRAFLKCLCIKEIFGLRRADFLYADATAYLDQTREQFDICVASGILYHMVDPVGFIRKISRVSHTLFIWTHYYDPAALQHMPSAHQFEPPIEVEVAGRAYIVSKRKYDEALNWAGFCGGSKPWALWLTRESLYRALRDADFRVEAEGFDAPDHPNGPALALVARRT